MEPLVPRITKSTSTAAIKARFETTAELLKRFEYAKAQANLWDGERDGLREAIKATPAGTYDDVLLSKTETAAVLYPNADGKYQIECTLQTTIPRAPEDLPALGKCVIAFCVENPISPEQFIDSVLHELQKSKEAVLTRMRKAYLGSGELVENTNLYKKEPGEKSAIHELK